MDEMTREGNTSRWLVSRVRVSIVSDADALGGGQSVCLSHGSIAIRPARIHVATRCQEKRMGLPEQR